MEQTKSTRSNKHLACWLLFIIAVLTIFSGCTTTQAEAPITDQGVEEVNTPDEITSATVDLATKPNVEYVGNFIATTDEKVIEARFSLFDESKEYTSADGTGTVRIENSEDIEVYSGTINPKREDFDTYTLLLTNEDFEAYVWEIPLEEIKQSVSSSGTMFLSFKTEGADFEELETDIWGLPTYSDEELAEVNEQEFLIHAISVNKKVSKGDFEVTVLKVGFFTPLVSWGEPEEYFRVDMEVKNIGGENEYFSPSGLAILDNQGNQFEKEYGGSLDTFAQIYPGVKKTGYVLFEKIPARTQTIKLVFEQGYDANYDKYAYEYSIPLTK